MSGTPTPHLRRELGLFQAISANMLEMIGVGPFLTIPLILSTMDGPQALLGWVLGAVVAICDGLVWAELGAAMPGSGGPYQYLSEAYGPKKLGRLMSFLFIWETIFLAPLSIGAGAVGFSQYTKFLWPGMGYWPGKAVAATVCLAITALLYRDIRSVGRLSIALWIVVIFTALAVTVAGLLNFRADRIFDFPPHAFTLSKQFFVGLGGATLLAMYDYGGYNNVCFFAGEVRHPERVIPRSILISIGLVAALYLTMNLTTIGVVPWQEAKHSTFIVSDLMLRLYGSKVAQVMTGLILFTTFASLFAVLLGYSRVPYAAAADGRFFAVFGKLHRTKNFPYVSVLFIGIASAFASLLDLSDLITALIVIQVLIQFMAQVVAVTLIRKYRPDIHRPFKMWFYPVTSIIAFAGWAYILAASGVRFILWGLALAAVGVCAYMWRARVHREWPFREQEIEVTV
ncbi:MAG: amino acid permease [Acidobacteria bacterium]|nr:amino acid permease [Acidobacteriota bacterium]MBS1865773.1 amino acid permease [Acidobacteriota bacterium]